MRAISICLHAIVCAFLVAFVDLASAEKEEPRPPFTIEVSRTLDRPVYWIKPKADKSGKTPGDIVLAFFKCVQRNDAEGAKKYCSIPPDDHWPPTIKKKENLVLVSGSFQKFFDLTREANIESNVVLSSTPIKGKAGWWHLTYLVKGKNPTGPDHQRLFLRKIDGTWKIIEPFWWGRIAAGERKWRLHW